MTRDELDAISSPREDALERWHRNMPKPEEPKPERRLDTAPIDWQARIDAAVAAERAFWAAVLPELIAEMQTQAADDLERATRSLTAELADLKATLAEVRLVLVREKGLVELPALGQLRH